MPRLELLEEARKNTVTSLDVLRKTLAPFERAINKLELGERDLAQMNATQLLHLAKLIVTAFKEEE